MANNHPFDNHDRFMECRSYMRVDDDVSDDDIFPLWNAAINYLSNAGIKQPDPFDCCGGHCDNESLYYLAVNSLTLHYYDHRNSVGSESEIPNGLRPIINQLKMEAEIAHITAQ